MGEHGNADKASLVKLSSLRQVMLECQEGPLNAYLVPSEDAHQSEYVSPCDQRRAYISGFDGSAGLALVTESEALLFTDGRYFLQASQQLSCDWRLMRMGEDPTPESWLAANLRDGAHVGVDSTCLSVNVARDLEAAVGSRGGTLVHVAKNLVDQVWANRPEPPAGKASVHPLCFAGRSVLEKLEEVRKKMAEEGAAVLAVTALDDVAWLLNIRGSDIPYNPVVQSYVLLTTTHTLLFMRNPDQLDAEVAQHLHQAKVALRRYEDFYQEIELLAQKLAAQNDKKTKLGKGEVSPPAGDAPVDGPAENGLPEVLPAGKMWIESAKASYAMQAAVERHLAPHQIISKPSPIALAKALKNSAELAGLRSAHIRDGAAVVAFFAWLDHRMQEEGAAGYFLSERAAQGNKRKLRSEDGDDLTEVSVADKLEALRSQHENFVGLSFPTISSVGPNAAVIHYQPHAATCARLSQEHMYLCDSGAQFLDGTTDVTRTVHFGNPTNRERACFTLVLQGHIKLGSAIFPNGTTGHVLDILARLPLWSQGLDYRHGTGHGVGAFLNVHEGPHLISFRPQATNEALQESMTVTNEPGYYEEGKFGIRIENVMVVTAVQRAHNFGGKGFLGFEPITWVPIQTKLMDLNLMTAGEMDWVDSYHARCREMLAPLMSAPEMTWLERATLPLIRP